MNELRSSRIRPSGGWNRLPGNLAWVMIAVALVGLSASVLVSRGLRLAEERVFELEFQHRAQDRATVIERQLRRSVAAVESIAALYAATDHVDRSEFRAFTSSIFENDPGFQALGYDPVIRAADREAYEAKLRAEGYADFTITEKDQSGHLIPAAHRELHVAVTYLEPLTGNEAALGYDIASESVRHRALARAVDSGKAAITGPLRLVQHEDEAEGWGALIAAPIVRQTPAAGHDAWASIEGFAVGALAIADVVEHAIGSLQPGGVDLILRDVTSSGDHILHEHHSRTSGNDTPTMEPSAADAYRTSFAFAIAGRQWEVLAKPTPALAANAVTSVPLWVFWVGLLITALLESYLGWQGTVRRRLQQALLERNLAEERQVGFGRMLDESQAEIYVFDAESLEFLHANRGARENTGYSMCELRGMIPLDLKPKITREMLDETLRPLREGERQKVDFTTVHERKDGSLYDVDTHLQLSTFDGRPAFFAVVMDITERKRFDERVRQSQRVEALGTLAGGIAHDFNNLITAILGYTELSLQSTAADSEIRANLDEVIRAAERARTLVARILAFSRRSPIERLPIEFRELVREVLDLVSVSAPANIEISEDLRGDCRIVGDASQIHQIVMNLCTNALHSMSDRKGKMEVELQAVTLSASQAAQLGNLEAGEYARLRIRDQGHGIVPADMERIFDPFFTTKKFGEGSGMGLSVVHGIVQSHAGGLRVASEPGAGSTFEVYLPLTEESLPQASNSTSSSLGSGESVLLVDDEAAVARLLSRMLEEAGYEVETFCDSHAALARFGEAQAHFDLVVTDFNMPGLKGTELARQLRLLKPDQAIAMLSGYGDLIDRDEISASGVKEFLSKPVRVEEFREVIRRALTHA